MSNNQLTLADDFEFIRSASVRQGISSNKKSNGKKKNYKKNYKKNK
jgi:hypothetical protein